MGVSMKSPKVTVLMSVYNGEKYLREAIGSILNQTFTDFEFIIIDDGSTDRTRNILTEYADQDQRIVQVRNQENIGLTQSLNKGIKLARGIYIARQDADDISDRQRLKRQINYMQKHPEVGLLGTAYHLIDENGKYICTNYPETNDTAIRWRMLFRNAFIHTSIMIRREFLTQKCLSYSENLPCSQDMGLWVQLMEYTQVANLKEPLVSLRRHDNSISTIQFEEQERIATEISSKQLLRLLPDSSLSIKEVSILRRWHKQLPRQLRKEDFRLCRTYLDILNIFSGQVNVDPIAINSIRFSLVIRIMRAVPMQSYRNLISTPGLIKSMIGQNILYALAGILRWFILHTVNFLRGYEKGV